MSGELSRVIYNGLAIRDNINIGETTLSGSFGRKAIIKTDIITVNSDELDVEFTVPFDDDMEANEAEIIIYNLSQNTISNIKYNDKITIEAGYRGDTGIIFSGYISKVSTKRDGVDKVTTINAIDTQELTERSIAEISYGKGTTASYILKDLVNRVKMPLAVFDIKRDHTYDESVKVDGELMGNIKKYAEICGVSAYVLKGKVYVRYIKDGDNIDFVVCENTGLLGSPESFSEEVTAENYKDTVEGYKIEMLLQHRVNTGAIINIESRDVKGSYRVRRGEHIFNNSESITKCEVI